MSLFNKVSFNNCLCNKRLIILAFFPSLLTIFNNFFKIKTTTKKTTLLHKMKKTELKWAGCQRKIAQMDKLSVIIVLLQCRLSLDRSKIPIPSSPRPSKNASESETRPIKCPLETKTTLWNYHTISCPQCQTLQGLFLTHCMKPVRVYLGSLDYCLRCHYRNVRPRWQRLNGTALHMVSITRDTQTTVLAPDIAVKVPLINAAISLRPIKHN